MRVGVGMMPVAGVEHRDGDQQARDALRVQLVRAGERWDSSRPWRRWSRIRSRGCRPARRRGRAATRFIARDEPDGGVGADEAARRRARLASACESLPGPLMRPISVPLEPPSRLAWTDTKSLVSSEDALRVEAQHGVRGARCDRGAPREARSPLPDSERRPLLEETRQQIERDADLAGQRLAVVARLRPTAPAQRCEPSLFFQLTALKSSRTVEAARSASRRRDFDAGIREHAAHDRFAAKRFDLRAGESTAATAR